MSAGGFFSAKYQADAGNGGGIHPIRIQPETLTLTFGANSNASPEGDVNNNIVPSTTGSKRTNGLTTRRVSFKFVNAPTGYQQGSTISLPWLDDTGFDTIRKGDQGTYSPLGSAEPIVVVGKTREFPE